MTVEEFKGIRPGDLIMADGGSCLWTVMDIMTDGAYGLRIERPTDYGPIYGQAYQAAAWRLVSRAAAAAEDAMEELP